MIGEFPYFRRCENAPEVQKYIMGFGNCGARVVWLWSSNGISVGTPNFVFVSFSFCFVCFRFGLLSFRLLTLFMVVLLWHKYVWFMIPFSLFYVHRGFVCNGKLNALSQYFYDCYFPVLKHNKQLIGDRWALLSLFLCPSSPSSLRSPLFCSSQSFARFHLPSSASKRTGKPFNIPCLMTPMSSTFVYYLITF